MLRVVYYIHQNPVHHGYCENLEDYKWSSYFFIKNSIKCNFEAKETLNWFGGMEDFIDIHKDMLMTFKENFIIE